MIKIEESASFSSILKTEGDDQNMLIFIKNDECDVCRDFYKYVESNFEKLIDPKLPQETKVFVLTINNFKNPNTWLFHIIEAYSFPTVLYLEKGMKVKGIFKGGDLYSFDNFLNNLSSDKVSKKSGIPISVEKLNKYSSMIKAYVKLKEDKIITEPTFQEIRKINIKGPNFISAMIEGAYYKERHIFPERITFIKDMLKKDIVDSSSFYIIHRKLIQDL